MDGVEASEEDDVSVADVGEGAFGGLDDGPVRGHGLVQGPEEYGGVRVSARQWNRDDIKSSAAEKSKRIKVRNIYAFICKVQKYSRWEQTTERMERKRRDKRGRKRKVIPKIRIHPRGKTPFESNSFVARFYAQKSQQSFFRRDRDG